MRWWLILVFGCSQKASPPIEPRTVPADATVVDATVVDAIPAIAIDAAIPIDAIPIDAAVPDAGVTLALRKDGCPVQFDPKGFACTLNQQCTYREGSCACVAPRWCGGAAPPRGQEEALRLQAPSWVCVPKVRADGCPGSSPEGSRCTKAKQQCGYNTCSCSTIVTCTKGTWVRTRTACKP